MTSCAGSPLRREYCLSSSWAGRRSLVRHQTKSRRSSHRSQAAAVPSTACDVRLPMASSWIPRSRTSTRAGCVLSSVRVSLEQAATEHTMINFFNSSGNVFSRFRLVLRHNCSVILIGSRTGGGGGGPCELLKGRQASCLIHTYIRIATYRELRPSTLRFLASYLCVHYES